MRDISELPSGVEVEAVFLAATIPEAERVVGLLEQEGVDCYTRLAPYIPSSLWPLFGSSTPIGLMVLVIAGQAPWCRRFLANAGLNKGLVE
jgi:hypothetical protein